MSMFQPLVDQALSGDGDSNAPSEDQLTAEHDDENQENETPTQN